MTQIDLTHRIIQPIRLVPNKVRWHPWRRFLQVLCGVVAVALPLTNGLRLDFVSHTFYFLWHPLAASDMIVLFWASILAVWLLVAISFVYGRLWCGWVCPQTLASDFSDSIRKRLDSHFRTRPGKPNFTLSRTIWVVTCFVAALVTSETLLFYWVRPATLLSATVAPWLNTSVFVGLMSLTALIFADLIWIRRRFCADACPYGAMLGTVADKKTMVVRFLEESEDDCIKCGKCVVDCPMGIDIKDGPGQFACIGCGECVDACNDVLGRRGKAGVIEYRFGTDADAGTHGLPFVARLGRWDAKRLGVVATLGVFAYIIIWLMFLQAPLVASVDANGAVREGNGVVSNGYTVSVTNGAPQASHMSVSVVGKTAATILSPQFPLDVAAHETLNIPLVLGERHSPYSAVARQPVILDVTDGTHHAKVKTIFYTPSK